MRAGWDQCAPSFRRHQAEVRFPTLEFIASGRLAVRLDARAYDLGAGSIFTYGPGMVVRTTAPPTDPARRYYIAIAGGAAMRLLGAAGLSPGTVKRVLSPLAVRELFQKVIDAGSRPTSRSDAICGALAEALLLTVGDTTAELDTSLSRAYETYLRCRQWLEDNGDTLQTLEQAAADCGLTPAYFCRLFRRFDRQSPYHLLRTIRMERAARQLRDGRMVKDVAQELNFSDPFQFSRAFKRIFGVPPSAYSRR